MFCSEGYETSLKVNMINAVKCFGHFVLCCICGNRGSLISTKLECKLLFVLCLLLTGMNFTVNCSSVSNFVTA